MSALDHDGNLWVSDAGGERDRVHKVDPATGVILLSLTGFGQATDIEVGPDGRVSIVNFNTSTIRTYEPDGTFVEETEPMPGVNQIAIDAYGRLFRYGGEAPGVFGMLPEPITTTSYVGPDNTSTVEPGFAAATDEQSKRFIDFDGDGFDHLAPHTLHPDRSGPLRRPRRHVARARRPQRRHAAVGQQPTHRGMAERLQPARRRAVLLRARRAGGERRPVPQ